MSDDTLTEQIRDVAFTVGYRMLGSRDEAEDIAQESLLRVSGPLERDEIDNPEAYTTTVATRLALDELRSARRRREEYVGPWLPEPIVEWDVVGDDRAKADEVSFALMVVLETLTPLERAAFLLRQVFVYEYDEIAAVLDRSPAACRQLASRARRRVAERRPAQPDPTTENRALLERFLVAASEGDADELVRLLADDVHLVADGGPTKRAARHPILGRARVARFVQNTLPDFLAERSASLVRVNGGLGIAVRGDEATDLVCAFEIRNGRICALTWILSPEKLIHSGEAFPQRPLEGKGR